MERAVEAGLKTLGKGHADLGGAQVELADVYLDQGRRREAVALIDEAYPTLTRAYGDENPRILRATLVNLRARLDGGQVEESARLLAAAQTMIEATEGEGLDALELRWLAARHEGSTREAAETPAARVSTLSELWVSA